MRVCGTNQQQPGWGMRLLDKGRGVGGWVVGKGSHPNPEGLRERGAGKQGRRWVERVRGVGDGREGGAQCACVGVRCRL